MAISVEADGFEEWEILRKISSLLMVATDCSIDSVRFYPPDNISRAVRSAIEELAHRNSFFGLLAEENDSERDEFGFVVVCRENGFICLRDADNRNNYAIYIEAGAINVDLASRTAYLITNLLGFSALMSFEVRFGIYELLSNIIEHGMAEDQRQWIQISLKKKDDKLHVSIIDRGVAFDPTGESDFDLERYLGARKRRGLGLIMARKIAGKMRYRRESGYNKIYFEKSMPTLSNDEKEVEMSQFEVGEPRVIRDGARIFQLAGDLDTKGALVIEDLINSLIEENWLKVVLDFERVPFVSSAGVGVLLGLVSTIREKGGEVYFTNLSPKVKSVFGLLNLDDYFLMVDQAELTV
jgi:anti-sigma B factor antagonist